MPGRILTRPKINGECGRVKNAPTKMIPKKYLFQLVQDLIMTAVLIALFGYHLFEETTHEWLGLAFFGLVISHLSLNTWWLKKLKTGDYNGYRTFQTVLNFALFLLFLTACISGILLSKHIFAEMPFHLTDDFTRKIHMLSTHWIQIIVAIHLGLHWKALAGIFGKLLRVDLNSVLAKFALPMIWLGVSLYGIHAFIQRELFPYLINNVDFAFFDKSEPQAVFFADYFAMLIAVAYFTRIAVWAVFFRKHS